MRNLPPDPTQDAICYCLDTSFLINGWRKHYAPDVFPSLWKKISDALKTGRANSCMEVYSELLRKDDDLLAWAKKHKKVFFKPTRAVLAAMSSVMGRHPNIASGIGTSINGADPWIVAHAIAFGQTVVTDERNNKPPNARKPPKLPYVCESMGVSWIAPIDFLKAIGVKL